jgi:hypothetical protein
MTVSECFLCGSGNRKKKNGLLRVHFECLLEFTQTSNSIKAIKDFMLGYRPKNEGDYPTIERYLKSQQDFADRCKKLDHLLHHGTQDSQLT